jgi:hypothetical protein
LNHKQDEADGVEIANNIAMLDTGTDKVDMDCRKVFKGDTSHVPSGRWLTRDLGYIGSTTTSTPPPPCGLHASSLLRPNHGNRKGFHPGSSTSGDSVGNWAMGLVGGGVLARGA